MKNIFRILISLLVFFSLFNNLNAAGKYSAVVKVVSYENIAGKYIQKLGWGSASVINNKGYIVTNNHVVDDGKGNVSDYFNICLTYDDNKKPKCDFTATLVDRDKDLDIAILKIDSKDIFGKELNYSEIETLSIDYNYDTSLKGDVYAIGYPSIGSETITKTKGIVSGTIDYNSHKYIKSDTLISGGNSGGALISKSGKLIGVPTFGIGSGLDVSIGYSILLAEAKDFIKKSLVSTFKATENISNFIKNKSKLDSINESNNISDMLSSFRFNTDYEVQDYIENRLVNIKPKLDSKYLVSTLRLGIMKTPKLDTQEKLFYFLRKMGVYYKGYHKLRTKNIGSLSFYYPVVIGDSTAGESSPVNIYVSQIGDDKLLLIVLYKPITKDSETNKIVNKKAEELLSGLNLNKTNIALIDFNFDIKTPSIKIQKTNGIVLDEVNGNADLYFGNLYDVFSIGYEELSVKNGKGKTVEEIYKNETLEIDSDYKSMIRYRGHKGFIYCDNSDSLVKDERGVSVKQNTCSFQIYDGIMGSNGKEYKIVGTLSSNKNKIKDSLDLVIAFMKNNVFIPSIGDGLTNMVNIYKNIIAFDFIDMKYQSDNYKNALKKLIKYKLVKNNKRFSPNKPIKWEEFILYYFRYMYNFDFDIPSECKGNNYTCLYKNNNVYISGELKNMYSVFKNMGIPLTEYVDVNKATVFIDHMKLAISGVDVSNFSENWYKNYSLLSTDSVFEKEKKMVDTFNNNFYGEENVDIYELLGVYSGLNYIQTKDVYFMKSSKSIVSIPKYSLSNYNYSSIGTKKENKFKYICESKDGVKCYKVLTKSLMIDKLMKSVNFTLFDEDLKNKKKAVFDN